MLNNKKQPIYRHTHLTQAEINRMKPLMESAFGESLNQYTGSREKIKQEKLEFLAGQYANRLRVASNLGLSPLNEDANIFAGIPNVKQLFENTNFSAPSNTLTMPNVANPMSSNAIAGGMWNPAYQAGTGDLPSYVFGLQSHIANYCIGFDMLPTIQVDTPKVVVQLLDTVYGGGPLDDKDNQPSYIELTSKLFTKASLTAKKFKRAQTKFIILGDETTKTAMEVRFMMASTVKATVVVEVLSTGKFDNASNAYTPNNDFSVKEIVDLVNDSSKTSKLIYTNTANYDSEESLTNLKVDFASAIRDAIPEAATNNNSLKMNRAQHEKGPKNKLNVISFDKQFEIDGIEIEADTTNIKIKDLAAQGINVIAELYNGVQNQLIQTIDWNILDHLYRLGVTNAHNTFEATGTNYSLYIGAPATPQKAFTSVDVEYEDILGNDVRSEMGNIPNSIQSAGYENQTTHTDRLFARILLVSEFMGQQNRIGTADILVVGGTLASAMKKNSQYIISPTLNSLVQQPELHYTGTIYGTINVYKNPKIDFNDPRVLLARRGDNTDSGAKFFAYDLAASRQTIAEGTMAEKIRVWSRFQIADIGFHPELNYYTFVAINDYGWA